MTATDRKQYDNVATSYTSVEDLPCARVEAELIRTALGDCTGLTVLDLGGGSGLHARRAIDAGAAAVDVVDISREMLRVGRDIETRRGRRGRIRWLEGDASRPLRIDRVTVREEDDGPQRPLPGDSGGGGYDVVMVNWLFDHATSPEDLRAMWENVVANLKPGGRFLGVRVRSIGAEYMKDGKYGATFRDVEEIPGGLRYVCGCLTQPPFEFGCTSMRSTFTLADDIPRELGLVDFEVIPPEETEVVKSDPEFWADFVKDPNLAVVVARKPSAG
ncbi:Ubiquinone/menaquinone biosynthesis C-methyltransferase UbiE [Madurella mycetomatis]|uniref:Ubiquinone/menaquinone biosynthesis C-methyltransferase UbiE n=1 Tax=Madurella mycetomatis TaxID=100816 RepID=A0A175VNI6_9PEZI|nr:Ubiquinone/menaquinone biosynthesis C-methyltransferase UbiE [Madurella mycetomatis]